MTARLPYRPTPITSVARGDDGERAVNIERAREQQAKDDRAAAAAADDNPPEWRPMRRFRGWGKWGHLVPSPSRPDLY